MFRQARWDEKVIFNLGSAGRRGFAVPKIETEVKNVVGNVEALVPQKMKRKTPPKLPDFQKWKQ